MEQQAGTVLFFVGAMAASEGEDERDGEQGWQEGVTPVKSIFVEDGGVKVHSRTVAKSRSLALLMTILNIPPADLTCGPFAFRSLLGWTEAASHRNQA